MLLTPAGIMPLKWGRLHWLEAPSLDLEFLFFTPETIAARLMPVTARGQMCMPAFDDPADRAGYYAALSKVRYVPSPQGGQQKC